MIKIARGPFRMGWDEAYETLIRRLMELMTRDDELADVGEYTGMMEK